MCEFEQIEISSLVDSISSDVRGNLEDFYSNIRIIFHYLKLDHDGDKTEGIESDIYDLYIIYYYQNKYYLDLWHREFWFVDISSQPYSLYYRYEISKEFITYTLATNNIYGDFVLRDDVKLLHSIYDKDYTFTPLNI